MRIKGCAGESAGNVILSLECSASGSGLRSQPHVHSPCRIEAVEAPLVIQGLLAGAGNILGARFQLADLRRTLKLGWGCSFEEDCMGFLFRLCRLTL